MSMDDWLRADMNPDDPGSQGYEPDLMTEVEPEPSPRGGFDCPNCGGPLRLLPFQDDGPDRAFTCPSCPYRYAD